MARIGVVGAGAWGTALASAVRRQGGETVLYAREPEVVEAIRKTGENTPFLPGVRLDPSIRLTNAFEDVAKADTLLLVTPAQHVRKACENLASHLKKGTPVVLCAKGIEQASGSLMSEVVRETLPQTPLAVLSGPTFADEVARGLPTAATLACEDETLGEHLQVLIGSPRFRLYLSDDIIGVQVGGAVKNVLAIACGIVEGRGLGSNARAALITRGLAEIARLGVVLGGQFRTFMGLSGLGDLTLTCSSRQSRNLSLGIALGEGKTLAEATAGRKSVAEGVFTAHAVSELASRLGLEIPIVMAVRDVLHRGARIEEAIEGLLARPIGEELPEEARDV
ncbi:MAG: NAD(P)H-dependent glycerol-3-phosphate dehydrogenase [Pseudomonadota bacterium]